MKKLLDDRRLLLPVLLTAIAIAVGSVLIIVLTKDPSSGDSTSASAPSSSTPSAGGGDVKINISDFKFKPDTVTVKAGSSITWVNEDTAPHTATAKDGFDTGTLKKGESKAVTVSKPGTFSYVCQFHAFMTGTVVVK